MKSARTAAPKSFKNAVLFSIFLHAGLVIFVAAAGSLSVPSKRGMIHYVNFVGLPGGPRGGPGSGAGPGPAGTGTGETVTVAKPAAPPPAKRETLRDLTLAQKVKSEPKASLRYPDQKAAKSKKTQEKKAAITKPEPQQPAAAGTAPATASAGGQQAGGYGLRFGTAGGGGGGGSGFGGGSGDPFGVESFPFTYYLQMVSDKISSNWFTSLVDPGSSGQFQAQVYFRIFRNGQVSDLRVESSSGVQAFDLAALRAVQSSSPFPPLPNEYNGQYLGIHLIFEHAK